MIKIKISSLFPSLLCWKGIWAIKTSVSKFFAMVVNASGRGTA